MTKLMPPKVSVILCTYNRCELLSTILESLAASMVPDSMDWEVLVVDNNSTDDTRGVVESFRARHGDRFHYLFESTPGKSYALNAGIGAARGEIVAFVDDDVTVEPTWLRNLVVSLDTHDWAGVGGRTLTTNEVIPPDWLALDGPYSLGGILAAKFDRGDQPCELEDTPFGANMAFRRSMFQKYGRFRTDLGPSPNPDVPRPNEDTEFGRRLQAGGEHIGYEPSAVAYHPIVESRIDKLYFLRWWFDYGRAMIREAPKRPDVFGIPRLYLAIPKIMMTRLVPQTLRWIFSIDSKRRFFSKCWVWATIGEIRERRRLCIEARNEKLVPGGAS